MLPETIRLNALDRYYVIPETDDPNGPYFPMSLVIGLTLKQTLSPEQVIRAIQAVNARFPQFRLGYTLDSQKDCWRKVPDEQLQAHLAAMVYQGNEKPLDDLISDSLPENITPLSRPFQVTLHGKPVLFKAIHAFGDGRLVMHLIAYILQAALTPAVFESQPPLALNAYIPLWRVVWQSPAQGFGVLATAIKTFSQSYQDFKTSPAPADGHHGRHVYPAVRSGSAMSVIHFEVTSEAMDLMDRIRKAGENTRRSSLNTLMQVLIAHRLAELGLTTEPPIYTIPVDLKRYLNQPDTFYPGNLASQIRIPQPLHDSFDLPGEALALQQKIDRQLAERFPLSTLPAEWLFALGGKKLYKKTNRDWLLNSPASDRRFFVLTNLGSLDKYYAPLLPYIAGTIAFAVPLMGAPPLVLAFLSLGTTGHLTLIYNPQAISSEQAHALQQTFSVDYLSKVLES